MNRDSKVKLVNEDGKTMVMEKKVTGIIERFWGDLFCVSGNTT